MCGQPLLQEFPDSQMSPLTKGVFFFLFYCGKFQTYTNERE